ncbi:MAG: hypothetical protein IJW47_00300 [Clostridia bacterium]|nr:hypothetical protein [Clostridia bacterium]
MEEKQTKFEFNYSAPSEQERKEIESIRRQYTNVVRSKDDKLYRLRKLNAFVNNSASVTGLVLGVIGLMIFGLGMTMVLEWALYLWGVIVGAVGVIPMVIAYPVYKAVYNKNKEKYGKEILALSEELLGKNE